MNIYVIEDEHWALMELVLLLERYESDHSIYYFDNGEDALEKAEIAIPDLVITDITMPGLNGIELIQKLQEKHHHIKFMILSVHDQFSYAQQGLKLGVVDYLLKPIKKQDLYYAIDSSIQKIEREKEKRELDKNIYIVQYLQNPVDSSGLVETVFGQKEYCIAIFLLNNWLAEKSWYDYPRYSIKKMKLEIMRYCSDIEDTEMICVDIENNVRIMMIPSPQFINLNEIRSGLQAIFGKMKKDIIVHVGYVEKSKTKSLHAAFEEGIALMERHIHFGASTFVTPFMKEREVNLANIWNRIRTIKSLLMTGDDEQAYELIHNIVRELQENHISLKQLNLLIQSIYYALLYEMQESFDIDGIHEDFQFIQKISSYQELEDYLEAMISQLKLINTTVELQPKHLVPKVLEWIHDNYDQSIVFQQFAYNHHVSLSYLSREFKAQTGYTFSEYLMMYRIQKAKEFITRGVKKIKEVASLVGYEDPKHFTSVFKRITGETPQQFRENLKL